MSEITPEDLIETIDYQVEDATVIPTPIDPTLTIPGEAADAKATGDAIAAVFTGATVNGKAPTNKAFVIYATDIKLSNEEGAQYVSEAIESALSQDASGVIYDTDNLITVKDALDDVYDTMDSELSEEAIDAILDDVFGGDE